MGALFAEITKRTQSIGGTVTILSEARIMPFGSHILDRPLGR